MGGDSLGILSGSSSGAHSLPRHSFILALLHTDSRLSLSCSFQLLPFFCLGLYVLTCPQELLLSFYDSYTLSLYFNSLVAFFMSHSPYSIFSAFYSHHYHFLVYKFTALSQPISLTPIGFFFRCRPRRIVFRFFGYCPRAGLFAAAFLSRFWNSAATIAWLGFALAAFCAFYAVFASPSQDILSGL